MPTQNENLIHVKLEVEEAIDGKKEILMIKEGFLNMLQAMQRYNELRMQELKSKSKIVTKTKALRMKIQRLQLALPKIKLYEIPHEKKEIPNSSKLRTHLKQKQTSSAIDNELEEIQRKLKALSA